MAKILLIDDHHDSRDIVGRILVMHGHRVEMADSAEEALRIISQSLPDLLVADNRLPGMSGLELLSQIRQSPQTASLPVIICSGDKTERETAMEEGAADFWIKGSEEMFDKIAKLDYNYTRKKNP